VIFDGGEDMLGDGNNNDVTTYSDETGNFKEIRTYFHFAHLDSTMIYGYETGVLLDRDYVNNQCYLCCNASDDTVIDLKHEMYEQITVDKDSITYYEEGVDDQDIDEELKMAVAGDTITYSVYTDYLPPRFLKTENNSLVDSRYRGKMIFLGDEYFVKDWDDNNGILKLAKGAERTLDSKAFGGDFTAGDGTYLFKINRAIFTEDQVPGIIIDVKMPNGAEVQVIAQRSLNAVIGDIEIYASNVTIAGDLITANVLVCDSTTELTLEDSTWFSDRQEWFVELKHAPLGCLVDLDGDNNFTSECSGVNAEIMPSSIDRERFKDYEKVDLIYGNEGMLQWVQLTLRTDYDGDDALGVGDKIMFPLDKFQFSYQGFKTEIFTDPICSGYDDKLEINKDGDHQVLISFTDDNLNRYDDVHLDNGPIEEGELFMYHGEVWEFIEGETGTEPKVTLKNRIDGAKYGIYLDEALSGDYLNLDCNDFDSNDTACVKNKPTNFYAKGSNTTVVGDIVYDGRYLYLANDTGRLGLNDTIVGEITHFDIDDNDMRIRIVPETGTDLNNEPSATENADDVLIEISSGGSICPGDIACDATYIDFYDKSRLDEDDWMNSVLVIQSDGGVLDDEDDEDTLWLPNSGAEIVVDYSSDDEIKGVTICHPRTRVYQTYFISTGTGIYPDENDITNNKINSNIIGIYSENSDSIINSNIVCNNTNLDLDSPGWLATSGNDNTCDKQVRWNDNNTSGCKHNCPRTDEITEPPVSRKSRGGGGSDGGSSSITFKKMCGNTLCEENETCESCPGDCGVCHAAEEPENISEIEPAPPECPDSCSDDNKCTDDYCSEGTSYTCKHTPIIPCCGNNLCEKDERCTSCPDDCGKCRLEVICTKNAAVGEAVECRVNGNKNNPLPDTAVKLITGNNTITKTTDENGIITFIPENPGIMDITFEKSGYDPAEINVSVTSKPEEKTFFDLITENKFGVSILILIIILLLYLLFIRNRKRKTKLESV